MITYSIVQNKIKDIVRRARFGLAQFLIESGFNQDDRLSLLTKLTGNDLCKDSRIDLINKLIAEDFKVISNITVTSDVLLYNKMYDKNTLLINTDVMEVSSRQSFVYNPNSTTYVN